MLEEYYKLWLDVVGFKYSIKKYKKNFDEFKKICRGLGVNPFAFLDYLFLKKSKYALPWSIHKAGEELESFKKEGKKVSLLEMFMEREGEVDKCFSLYKRMGLSNSQIFLMLKGEKIDELETSNEVKKVLERISKRCFGIDKDKRLFIKRLKEILRQKDGVRA